MMSGFVIDTAGVFCAVILDQHSDLYIDKDDLMPELVSDDDTDSEDESPPYRRNFLFSQPFCTHSTRYSYFTRQ